MSLLPVTWIDGWPIIGEPGADTIGRMVWSGKKPAKGKKIVPQTSDEFNKGVLPPQWEWNYQPQNNKWSLTERKGWLRLHAFKPIEQNNLLKAGNTITQRTYRTQFNEAIIKVDISKMEEGQKAGLCHFSSPNYSAIGIVYDSVKMIEYNVKGIIVKGPLVASGIIWLKSTWGFDGKSQYYYSLDGKTYTAFGGTYQMAWGSYRGDRIGIYNYNNKKDAGYVDIDWFNYHLENL